MNNYGEFKRFIEDMKDGYSWFTQELDGDEVPDRIWKRNIKMAIKEGLIKEVSSAEAKTMNLYQINILDEYPECKNCIVYIII